MSHLAFAAAASALIPFSRLSPLFAHTLWHETTSRFRAMHAMHLFACRAHRRSASSELLPSAITCVASALVSLASSLSKALRMINELISCRDRLRTTCRAAPSAFSFRSSCSIQDWRQLIDRSDFYSNAPPKYKSAACISFDLDYVPTKSCINCLAEIVRALLN